MKTVLKKLLYELFVGIVAGCVASLLFIFLINRNKEIDLIKKLNTIQIAYSEKYVKQLYGEPIVSFDESGLINSYYNVDSYVLRCVYNREKILIAYIIYMNPFKRVKYKYISKNEVYNYKKPLGEFTYYEFNPYIPAKAEGNIAAVGAGNNYYEEKFCSGNPENYNYYLVGNYLDNNENYIKMLNLFNEFWNDYEKIQNSFEYLKLRKLTKPNVYGVIEDGYEDLIDIITSNAREFDRILVW